MTSAGLSAVREGQAVEERGWWGSEQEREQCGEQAQRLFPLAESMLEWGPGRLGEA